MSLIETSVPACDWQSLAVSYYGHYIVAGCSTNTYVSQDFAKSWVPINKNTVTVTTDILGQHMVVVDSSNGVWYSQDYGSTWMMSTGVPTTVTYSVVVMSGSSERVYLGTSSSTNLYTSLDQGASFSSPTTTDMPNNCISMATSSTGQFLAIVSSNANYQGVQLSNDYGTTFQNYLLSATNNAFSSVSMSSSGKYIVVSSGAGEIYVSNNFGNTWTQTSDFSINGQLTDLQCISMGSSGSDMAVVGDDINQGFSVSTNHGTKWSGMKDKSHDFNLVVVTGDSKWGVFAESNGGIYLSKDLFDQPEDTLPLGGIIGIIIGVLLTALFLFFVYYKGLLYFKKRLPMTPEDVEAKNNAAGSYEKLLTSEEVC